MTTNEPRDDLACPEGLSPKGVAAHAAIMAVLRERGLTYTGGCRAFYSPAEWKARGEEYGCTSELVICHDGGALHCAFSWDSAYNENTFYSGIEGVNAALEPLGLYVEACTGWYSAVYAL